MEKLVIHVSSYDKPRGNEIIRIERDAYNLLEVYAKQTGLSKMKLASMMIRFASNNIEIVQDAEEDE